MTPPPAPRPLPLRWGDAATRWWVGGWLIVGGATLIAGSHETALWALAIGTGAHLAGWAVLPVEGWRRLVALPLSTLASYLLLAGPRFTFVLALTFLCWLLVRGRPLIAWLSVAPVITVAILTGNLYRHDYTRMLPALAAVGVTMVLCAWLAELITRLARRRG